MHQIQDVRWIVQAICEREEFMNQSVIAKPTSN